MTYEWMLVLMTLARWKSSVKPEYAFAVSPQSMLLAYTKYGNRGFSSLQGVELVISRGLSLLLKDTTQ